MSYSVRFGLAVSSAALACALAACASPQGRTGVASSFGGKADGDTGLAMRALTALNANDLPAAVGFAERAVARTPDDAGFRGLLGNIYFAAGRFASAEAAYKDSLTIYSNQPQVVLKLALVQIAQGKSSEAAAFLEGGRAVLQPADYGLAVALSGRPADAVEALRAAAREPGADGRVRQNLALAYALSGDWTNARVVAAQDLAPDQVNVRIQQWMKLASPGRASDQVAALTGVAPAASDPGQPVRLALRQGGAAVAIAIPKYVQPQTQAQPKPAPQPQPVASRSVPKFTAPMPTYGVAAAVPPAAPPANPARVADVAPPAVVPSRPAPEIAQVAPPVPPVAEVALFAPPSPALPQVELFLPPPPVPVIEAASFAPPKVRAAPPLFTRAAAEQRKARLQRAAALVRSASLRRGGSTAVVQLGAYGSPNRVVTAWNAASRRYSALRAYAPMSASFASSNGKVYRLSVRGFANQAEASALCSSMRRKGGSCFVRTVAGDAPVRIASR
jgi:D-alanyl-D-alanine carboxypeptidase